MSQLILPAVMVAFVAMLYFGTIKPQKKRAQDLQRVLSQLKPGDEIVTVAGIYGTVTEIEEGDTLLVEVAENTEIRIARSAVAGLVNQSTTAAAEQPSDPAPDKEPA